MRTHLSLALSCFALLASCDSGGGAVSTPTPPTPSDPQDPTVLPPDPHATEGAATPATPGATLPAWHPTVPLANPDMADGHVGRAPRRLSEEQLRASLLNAVGLTWVAPRRVLTADDPRGYIDDPNVDMLDALGSSLGRPDYIVFTTETLTPGATFSKLVGDAARKACRDGIAADLLRPQTGRMLLRFASEADTVASNLAAVQHNLSYLVLRFWARSFAPTDPQLAPLQRLFTTASTAPASGSFAAGTTADGWRAVCIALVTDQQFLTY